ncbi:MAG: type II secretion system protein J [Dissulfuribacterales bacterium]
MACRYNKGFTLIELLISITIVGVILVIIMGAFRIGIRAWETGERDIENYQRQQIVLSLVKHQLASAGWYKITKRDKASFYFKGDSKSLECISAISVSPGNAFGNVYVNYRITPEKSNDGQLFEMFEQNITGISPEAVLYEADEEGFHELIHGAYAIFFEYLKKMDTGELQWQDDWDPEKDVGLPAAVRLVLQVDAQSAPVTMIARIQGEKVNG